jgi:shikimate dehydrogenase
VVLHGKRILILGAGGAARGVLRRLLDEQPARLAIANNTASKALVADCANVGAGGLSDFQGERFDVVINATSASLGGATAPLPLDCFADGALAYDMSYGMADTPFMTAALRNGASSVADGFGMLAGQAAESFHLWRGVRPDIVPVIAAIRASWK